MQHKNYVKYQSLRVYGLGIFMPSVLFISCLRVHKKTYLKQMCHKQ
ncbi:hypothetical protein X975_15762, partial [Stegodyphus mimosarum]